MQTATALQPRMKNPAAVLPGAWQAIQAVHAATGKAGVPAASLDLVHLRASQINGCRSGANPGRRKAREAGAPNNGLSPVPPGGAAPYSTDAGRPPPPWPKAAPRLSDRADPVPDRI